MDLWTGIKVKLAGRESIAGELGKWRRAALRENGAYSFVSAGTDDLEVHHGFHVKLWPCFALSRWNDWVMTKEEHRDHPRSYHSWERRNFKSRFTRIFIAGTPLGLYIWKYFYWHWWKGWIITTLFFAGLSYFGYTL